MLTFTSKYDGQSSLYPADFDRGEYARGILEERRQAGVTVTASVFSPCGQFLICASDSGRLALWELAPFVDRDAWSGPERPDPTPDLSFQADASCINSLAFAGDVLLCGGDESLFGWPLSELRRVMETGEAPAAEPAIRVRCPQGRIRRGGLLPFPEINDVRYDQANERVLCAAGDSMGYEWDLQSPSSPVCTYEGHQGYLHAIANASGSSLLATASEDGLVGLFDRRTQHATPSTGCVSGGRSGAIDFLGPTRGKAGKASKGEAWGRRSGERAGEQDWAGGGTWVSIVEVDDGGHTLVSGGGGGSGVDGAWDGSGRGWVSQWNLATRTCISTASLRAEVQCMTTADEVHTVVVGSAEPVVKYFKRAMLETQSSTSVTPRSVHSLAVNRGAVNHGMTCIAGAGPTINMCTLPGIIAFSLYFM